MTFEDAFKVLIGHEGGYVNDPKDPGGETKYGISKRAYPGEDIAGLLHEALSTWLLLHIKREDKNFVPDVKRSMGGMVSGDDGGDWLSRSVSGFFGKGR